MKNEQQSPPWPEPLPQPPTPTPTPSEPIIPIPTRKQPWEEEESKIAGIVLGNKDGRLLIGGTSDPINGDMNDYKTMFMEAEKYKDLVSDQPVSEEEREILFKKGRRSNIF